MERRRFARLAKCLPLEYQYTLPGSEELCKGKGLSQNISLGGIFLNCDRPQPALGQLLELIITEEIHQPSGNSTRQFKMSGKVVRLEPPQAPSGHLGVAVEFLIPMGLAGLLGQGHSGSDRQVSKIFH